MDFIHATKEIVRLAQEVTASPHELQPVSGDVDLFTLLEPKLLQNQEVIKELWSQVITLFVCLSTILFFYNLY